VGIAKSVHLQYSFHYLAIVQHSCFLKSIFDPSHPIKTWVLSWVSEFAEKSDTQAVKPSQNIALGWYENQTGHCAAKHRTLTLARLNTYLFPSLGNIAISKLEPQDLLAVVRAVEKKGGSAVPHSLVQLVGRILRYAIKPAWLKRR